MSEEEIKNLVLETVTEFAGNGSGWSQEGVVLREIRDRFLKKAQQPPDITSQQAILNAWHDLFMEKKLAWGFDLDNPNSPFFHVRDAGH